ncbi:E3 ubiquitin-protein ligase TRIM71-like [Ostrea edulis]|uniref:E3 ubiquitin-protein ligase TRIM71-like n=1 Tax=Ostrea edulis TaxID=37623 RepID=UPI0024AF3D03|nr:E3 ubiquitin-protein ligase TRIM71-like [Ostrea edulis]
MLHPRRSAQDVLLCDSCETVPLQSHCEICQINLCTNCVGKHLLDSSRKHRVVPFKERSSTPDLPKCPKHTDKHCELYCEKCEIPVCSTCVSDKHRGHILCDVLKKLGSKTQSLQRDLEELESIIYPRYEEIASIVQTEKSEFKTNYGKLTRAADQHGEIWHRKITAIVNQQKSDIVEMETKHMAVLDKTTDEITHSITELKEIILNLKAILESNDISLISTYKSRNTEFKRLPPKVRVTLPTFSPQKINTDQLREMFGSLSPLSINTEEYDYTMKSPEAVSSPSVKQMKSPEAVSSPPVKPMKSPEAVSSPSVKQMKSPEAVSSPPVKPMKSSEAVSSPPVKPLLDEPQSIANIDTGYKYLCSVSCLSDEQVWTRGDNEIMNLLNFQGKVLSSIQTQSGYMPWGITVTRDGDLVYTDWYNGTVNLVKNKQIQTVVTLQGWIPRYVCSAYSDDLLVTMDSDDGRQSKVVRYSGSRETQTIQFDDQGRPLYSSNHKDKYISENRNLDICVADRTAEAVVVVNQSGKFRFRYTGHPYNTKESFTPYGITTDSQSHILTADHYNHRIHILDQDGQFLRYVQCFYPYGLCVDIRDNLFVTQLGTGKVKKIQYLKTHC